MREIVGQLKSGDKIESVVPAEPDWKQLYYALALRVVAAHMCYRETESRSIVATANDMIERNEKRIEIGNSIQWITQGSSADTTGHES